MEALLKRVRTLFNKPSLANIGCLVGARGLLFFLQFFIEGRTKGKKKNHLLFSSCLLETVALTSAPATS
jgi:hypothetical protein